jgi:hypothetical protein
MTNDRDKLEKWIGAVLREQPPRRAPSTLEARVLATIEARGATSWWRKGFVHWPMLAQVSFILASFAIVKFALLATDRTVEVVNPSGLVADAVSKVSWIKVLAEAVYSGARSIPEHWLWAGLAVAGMVYGVLFAISAIAYRALYASR